MVNPMDMLDMEKRTGISNNDVDSFVSQVDAVSKAIEGIMNGTLKEDDDIDVPGYKTPKQLKEEEEAKQKRALERKERKEKKKKEEKENWWNRAKMFVSCRDMDEDEKISKLQDLQNTDVASKGRIIESYQKRDANDYSPWEKWEPITNEEKEEREKKIEKAKNDAFEKQNSEFCNQFKEDLEKRKKLQEEKEHNELRMKQKGNDYFKKKMFEKAIECYMKILECNPYNAVVLTNIAQAYLRLEKLEDTLEFCNRALYIDPLAIKALSRRAVVHTKKKDLQNALKDLNHAVNIAPDNLDLLHERDFVQEKWNNQQLEIQLEKQIKSNPELMKLQSLLENKDYQAISLLLDQPHIPYQKILMRTSGALLEITNHLKLVLSSNTTLSNIVMSNEKIASLDSKFQKNIANEKTTSFSQLQKEMEILQLLHVLHLSITNEKENKKAMYSNENLLVFTLLMHLEENSIVVREKVLELLEECSDCVLWQDNMCKNKPFLQALVALASETRVEIMSKACYLIHLFSQKGIVLLRELAVIEALTSILEIPKKAVLHKKHIRQNVTHSLANLFMDLKCRQLLVQNEHLRHKVIQQLIQVISNSESDSREARESALAALSNLSFEVDTPCRQELITFGIIPVAITILQKEIFLDLLAVRTSGILSRCSTLKSSLPYLKNEKFLKLVLCKLQVVQNDEDAKHVKQHLIRVLVSLMEDGLCLSQEQLVLGVKALVQLLPPAQFEFIFKQENQSTSRSSCMEDLPLLTNVTKCLIHCVNDPYGSAVQELKHLGGIERTIELLRVLPDGAARKNCAIILAKLCKNQEMKQKIKELRGIEMLMSVGKALIA